MTPYQKAGFNELSLFRIAAGILQWEDKLVWLINDDGARHVALQSACGPSVRLPFDEGWIKELPKDAGGFYLWDGGECPVPGDWEVKVRFFGNPYSYSGVQRADCCKWEYSETTSKIVAFKPISRPDMPRHSDGVDHAENPVVIEDGCDISGDTSALDVQEGGDHYKKLKIQPMEYSMANKLDACQHTIIKYVTRFRDKGGIEDLRKAKHCIDMLIEFEQQENKQ
ncbi:MAG: DUF3310 domain-containing protein [Rickettsiales bacterium]